MRRLRRVINRKLERRKSVSKEMRLYRAKFEYLVSNFGSILTEDEFYKCQAKLEEMKENVKKVKKVKAEEESLKKRPSEADNIETNHPENEESLNLPDVPVENPVQVNSIDQEIEDRLLKLKFFNRVWLPSKEPVKTP